MLIDYQAWRRGHCRLGKRLAAAHLTALTHAWITASQAGCCFGEVRRPVKNLLLPLADIMQDSKWYIYILLLGLLCGFPSPQFSNKLQMTKKGKKKKRKGKEIKDRLVTNRRHFACAPLGNQVRTVQVICCNSLKPHSGRAWWAWSCHAWFPPSVFPPCINLCSSHGASRLSPSGVGPGPGWISFVVVWLGAGGWGRGCGGDCKSCEIQGDLSYSDPSLWRVSPGGRLRKFSQLCHRALRSSLQELGRQKECEWIHLYA